MMAVRRDVILAVVASLSLSLLACAGAGGRKGNTSRRPEGKPVVVFPKQADLAVILKRPVTVVDDSGFKQIESWNFETATVAPGPLPQDAPWNRELTQLAAQHSQLRVGVGLNCVATEVARVWLAEGKLPDDEFLSYLGLRCEVDLPSFAVRVSDGTFPDSISDAQLWSEVQASSSFPLDSFLGGGPRALGLGVVRSGDRV